MYQVVTEYDYYMTETLNLDRDQLVRFVRASTAHNKWDRLVITNQEETSSE